jgi:hypothetical protein
LISHVLPLATSPTRCDRSGLKRAIATLVGYVVIQTIIGNVGNRQLLQANRLIESVPGLGLSLNVVGPAEVVPAQARAA